MWDNFLKRSFFGNDVSAYLIAAGMLLGGFLLVWIFHVVVLRQAGRWAAQRQTKSVDFLISALRRTLAPILYFGVVYLALRSLALNESVAKAINFFGVLLVTIAAVRFLLQAIRFGIFQV